MKTLIVLIGPTGVGKTELSLRLAEHFGTCIISADSRQLYADLKIGTAAPTPEQLQRVRHYFVGTLQLTDYYSAAQYEAEVLQLLEQLYTRHEVGGFGMIQGGCRFSKDIPPYIIAGREPICYAGINIVGLRRRGFSNETIEAIHNAYRIIYQSGLNNTEALKKIENEMEMTPEISYIVNFIRESARGIIPASK